LRQLFDRYPTYVGSSPYLAPATLAIIPYIEFAFGGWYVRGGLYSLIETLVDVANKQGVALCANAPVISIDQKDGVATGVSLASGQRIPADVVVMNGDAATLPQLLGEHSKPAKSRSMSGFVMLFGLRSELPRLAANTVFFSAAYRREFSQIFGESRFPDDPTVYVNAPSRLDRSLVPDGCGETLFVMANTPARVDRWSDTEICTAKTRVMLRLRQGGLDIPDDQIAVHDIWTPRRIEERYLMPGGAIYGTDSHGWRNAFLRPRNQNQQLRGLYLVGGSTHPGGGTPTVLLAAEITANLIAKHENA
jgi:phytoene desaturase